MDTYQKLFEIYTKSISINDFVKNITREINNPIALINENFQIISMIFLRYNIYMQIDMLYFVH